MGLRYICERRALARRVPPVSDQPIEGSPSWVKSQTFTIEAKPEIPQTIEMMRGPMLQVLLEDRFKLKIHRGTRQVPNYALAVARGGPKLDAAKKDSCTAPPDFSKGIPPPLTLDQPPPCGAFSPDGKGGTRTFCQTLAGLSAEFSALLGRRVADRTGIEGTFDIHLDVDFNGPPCRSCAYIPTAHLKPSLPRRTGFKILPQCFLAGTAMRSLTCTF
jgi:uncharacterized protein (TIGR03435 family)